jgi:hypothetical protein
MRKSVIAGLALSATFAAFAGKTHADVNYPWCIIGNTRAIDCYFSSREQCMQDGRNRGFGGQCIQNPYYKPGRPSVSGPVNKRTVPQTARPSQTVSAAQQAMQECRRQYGGGYWNSGRFYGHDQWAWIEGCFKEKTGLYPGQAK